MPTNAEHGSFLLMMRISTSLTHLTCRVTTVGTCHTRFITKVTETLRYTAVLSLVFLSQNCPKDLSNDIY